METNFYTHPDLTKALLAKLCLMARVDNRFSWIESKYLEHVAKELKCPPHILADIRNTPDEYDLDVPAGERERMTILYYLLFMLRADGEINPEEENFSFELGLELGFRDELIEDLIKVVKTYPIGDIPQNAMIEQVKKYMN